MPLCVPACLMLQWVTCLYVMICQPLLIFNMHDEEVQVFMVTCIVSKTPRIVPIVHFLPFQVVFHFSFQGGGKPCRSRDGTLIGEVLATATLVNTQLRQKKGF